jgi:hypothetical protein
MAGALQLLFALRGLVILRRRFWFDENQAS